jgi:hypothetical protein
METSIQTPVQLTLVGYTLQYHSTSTPDYFEDSNLPVVQVLVDESSSINSIKDDLTSYPAMYLVQELDNFSPSLYQAAVDNLFPNVRVEDSNLALTELIGVGSSDDDDEWDLYMYFTLTEIYQ